MKEERKCKCNKYCSPLAVLSSAIENADKSDDDDTKLLNSNKSHTTPTKKLSIKLRKVTPIANEIKIVQVKSEKNDK